ncbi:MAG: hypothetical protein AAF770_03185 [Bacteroidota bacterium]
MATAKEIKTDFVRKERVAKNEKERKQIASTLRKERASFLEESFGNKKEHNSLQRINASTAKTENLWIFFEIHTPDAAKLGHRISAALLLRKVA